MCKYCCNEGAIQWDCEEVGISVSYENGKLTIENSVGDETCLNFPFCPMCGRNLKRKDYKA